MQKRLLTYIAAVALCSLMPACRDKTVTVAQEPAAACKPEKQFRMYEMSEMATLMEQMYAENMQLKQRITSGDSLGNFPEHILNIHTAVMTDGKDNDAFFKAQANTFIAAQQNIYADPEHAKEHFNAAVSSCVACHEQKCHGPIPRIKKLYIK